MAGQELALRDDGGASFLLLVSVASSVSMVQLSSPPVGTRSPPGHSEEGAEGSMKSAKPPVNLAQLGENQRAMSPLQSTISSAASPSQAYETYIDNGLMCLKHKIRNIEKKKLKLQDYKDRLKNGEHLNPDQLEAVQKYDEVLHNLEFAKELQKTFSALSQDLLKTQKKAQRREHMLKLEAEKKKLRTILQAQYVLQNLTQAHVQQDFRGGLNGAVYLPSNELDFLIKFSKLTCPERNEGLSVEDQMEQSSLYFWDLLEGSEKAVVGTTYKHVKDLLSKLLNSGYFESIPVPKNSKEKEVSLEEEMLMQSEKKKQLLKTESIKESESLMELAQPEIKPQEFLNRRYITEINYSSKQEEQSWEANFARKPSLSKCWDLLPEKGDEDKKPESSESWESPVKHQEGSLEQRELRTTLQKEQKQPVSLLPPGQWKQEPPKSKTGGIQEEPSTPETPKPWIAQLQKEDPKKPPPVSWASVQCEQHVCRSWTIPKCREKDSVQPGIPKSWENNIESQKHSLALQSQISPKSWEVATAGPFTNDQLLPRKFNSEPKDESVLDFDKPISVIPSSQPPSAFADSIAVSSEQNLSSQSDFLQEPLQAAAAPATGSSGACSATTHQASLGSETKFMISDTSEAAVSLSQPPAALASPNPAPPKGFQSPPAGGSPVAISTAPFQAMQTVFNVNAPIPSRQEQDVQESPYSSGYNQSFTSTSTQTPPQCPHPAVHVEQMVLSPETAAGYHLDGTVQVSSGSLAFYPAHTSVCPRHAQPLVSSQGSVRACMHGGKLLANPYRSPGAYKGFDGHRGPPSVSNGNYSQLQLQAREYLGTPYAQRDNFRRCYKRGGTAGGPPATSRAGWSSPERESEAIGSGDCGQGASRSMTPVTPVDVSVTNTAAAVLPVHIYPLPQQMRVAFSAARTSNLAPGTLDQPIVFDLLLNNLGETFDLELGRFICPVNGTYVFIFHMLKLAVNVPLYVNLMKNEEVLVSAYANDGAPDHETASNHAILQLLQGDQIWLRLHRGAIYGSSWKYSTFSGYLLYQD